MKRAYILPILILFVLSVGCSSIERRDLSIQRTTVTESYRLAGELLESTRITLRVLCDNNVFSIERCEGFRVSYEKAANNFLKAGDKLIKANRLNQDVSVILSEILSEIRRIRE